MKVLLINAVCGIKSTGRICIDIAKQYEDMGAEVKIAYGRDNVPEKYEKYAVRIGTTKDVYYHAFMSKVFGDRGYWSRNATKKFLEWADQYNPDILWLHNIHDYFINIEMLFDWIKSRKNMKIKWTHHDCWAFTGYCGYFSHIGCEKWKKECNNCYYSKKEHLPLIDNTKRNYYKNKELFTGIENLIMITPSQWLADLIKQSYLGEYEVKVLHNRIDKSIFRPTYGNFRDEYNINDKFMILGVASPWSDRKGLNDFIKMSCLLKENYIIVLVGVNKKQKRKLPHNIIGITRTDSASKLAEIYTAADVFVNPTYEDNYPTTNLEAQACGTPVITYRTGGSPESVPDKNICEQGNIEEIVNKIINKQYYGALNLTNEEEWTRISEI